MASSKHHDEPQDREHLDTLGRGTKLAHLGEDRLAYHGAAVPPLFQSSLFTFDSWESIDKAFDHRTESFIYSRGQNPTVRIAEEKIADLAGGEKARLCASGMAAISAAVLSVLGPGDHVVALNNIYGPARTLLSSYLAEKMEVETTFVSGEDLEELVAAITPRTRLLYLESPTSVVFALQDLAAVAKIAKEHGLRTIIDNTWATPIFQRPLELGIDLEIHSCSKYLGGHSDLVAGVVIGREADIHRLTVREFEILGGKMAPWEAWLLTRSLRTLPMRMARHQSSALAVAKFLENHSAVKTVRYPGLESHPQRELVQTQMSGTSGLLSFELATADLTAVRTFVNSLQVVKIGVSWGGHESLVYAPAISYLKEHPPEAIAKMGIALGDIRLSVGLEEVDDLVADLDRGLGIL